MKRLAVINGMRGYAILGVIYFHLIGTFLNQPGWQPSSIGNLSFYPFTFLGNGWLGVNLFFILSGFVLYLPYANGSRQITSSSDTWSFYKHRASRLFPLYYTLLIISMIFIAHEINVQDFSFWKNLLLMSTFTFNFTKETFIPQSNYVLWSLGIEVLFSVAFPLLIMGIKKMGIVKFTFAVFYLSFIVRVISCFNPEFMVAPHLNMIKDSLFGRLDDFMAGMIIAHWFVTNWKEEWLGRKSVSLFFVSIVIVLVGCNLSDLIYLNHVPFYLEPLINSFFQLGFGMMLLSLLHMKKNVIRYFFTNYFLQLTGMMCYSLYLWHGNLRWFFIIDFSPLRIVSYLGFLFLLSFLTYRYIEFGNKEMKDVLPKE
jgi:peptidoglycan/LPS O-acetylase OafA/YrhL